MNLNPAAALSSKEMKIKYRSLINLVGLRQKRDINSFNLEGRDPQSPPDEESEEDERSVNAVADR